MLSYLFALDVFSPKLPLFERLVAIFFTTNNVILSSWLVISCLLFLAGMFGIVYNYKNLLVTMMCIEIMYLGAVTSFVYYGIAYGDSSSTIYGLLILIFAACESAVGLGLLVAVYRWGRLLGFSSLAVLGG